MRWAFNIHNHIHKTKLSSIKATRENQSLALTRPFDKHICIYDICSKWVIMLSSELHCTHRIHLWKLRAVRAIYGVRRDALYSTNPMAMTTMRLPGVTTGTANTAPPLCHLSRKMFAHKHKRHARGAQVPDFEAPRILTPYIYTAAESKRGYVADLRFK